MKPMTRRQQRKMKRATELVREQRHEVELLRRELERLAYLQATTGTGPLPQRAPTPEADTEPHEGTGSKL